VEQGETTGVCAEAKRLWKEAGLAHRWPPAATRHIQKESRKAIALAAETIALTRLLTLAKDKSDANGDTPYMELYDGTTWRLTNGTRKQIGLMTAARLGALMTDAGKTADGEKLDPTCRCCKKGHDTARHMMLECKMLHRPRTTMQQIVKKIWNKEQRRNYEGQTTQERYMTLLGKQMDYRATEEQQKQLDSAVKHMLSDMNTIRMEQYQLQSLVGKTYNRPPEETAQMAELWQDMERKWEQRRGQELQTDDEDADEDEHEQTEEEEEEVSAP
jgi:hypothetical protein